jgi:hypothetical protein
MLSESQFLELWNACVKEAKPRLDGYKKPESLDVKVTEETMGLDSLDKTLTLTLCADAYQIDAEEEHNIPNVTLKEVYDWFQEKKTRDFETVEEALEATL